MREVVWVNREEMKMVLMTTPETCAHILTMKEAREALNRVLHVCRESGIRKLGIHKRIDENKNLVRCLSREHMVLGQSFITFITLAESSRNFFDDIVDAFKETFPDVGKESDASLPEESEPVMECMDRFIEICGTGGENSAELQTENRDIVYLLKHNAAISERIGFIESWPEDHELFFEDLRHALEGVFKKIQPSGELAFPAYIWPGNDFTGCQIQFDTGKRTKFFDILMRACHRKSSRTMD